MKLEKKILEIFKKYINVIISAEDLSAIINDIVFLIEKEYCSNNSEMEWFKKHPVSRVQWVPIESVHANDYNPNSVAPPEMKLLKVSIESDGYTQPIVVWEVKEGEFEVVDGFHRHIVGKKMNLTHLPVVVINKERISKSNRMASTIRHNRARGKHAVMSMSEIVKDLSRMKWSDQKISKELGMDEDEVLRLKQISGLMEMFEDKDFSKAWEFTDDDLEESGDEVYGEDIK